jgi:fructokinase
MRVISIGEVLWDLVGNGEHLGGATFNFSAHLSRLGHEVAFVSGVGADERGQRVIERMAALGLTPQYLHIDKDNPTGIAAVALASDGQPKFILQRPAAYDFPQLSEDQFRNLFSRPVDWVYFGTLHQIGSQARQMTRQILERAGDARRFYDINLRLDGYNPSLLRELMASATIVKLNHEEVDSIAAMFGTRPVSLEKFCRRYAEANGWDCVCVTRGSEGCAVLRGDQYIEASGYSVNVVDAVGAGDAFAAAFIHGINRDWPLAEIADFANRVGALVASRRGAIPDWTIDEAKALRHEPVPVKTA